MSASEIAAARLKAAAARAELLAAAHDIQARLKPAILADNALDEIKRKGEAVVRKRPVAVSAAAGGLIALIAARPVGKLFGLLKRTDKGGDAPDEGDNR